LGCEGVCRGVILLGVWRDLICVQTCDTAGVWRGLICLHRCDTARSSRWSVPAHVGVCLLTFEMCMLSVSLRCNVYALCVRSTSHVCLWCMFVVYVCGLCVQVSTVLYQTVSCLQDVDAPDGLHATWLARAEPFVAVAPSLCSLCHSQVCPSLHLASCLSALYFDLLPLYTWRKEV